MDNTKAANGKCVADVSGCPTGGSGRPYADYHGDPAASRDYRSCVATCPNGHVANTVAYTLTNTVYSYTSSSNNICYAKEVFTSTTNGDL